MSTNPIIDAATNGDLTDQDFRNLVRSEVNARILNEAFEIAARNRFTSYVRILLETGRIDQIQIERISDPYTRSLATRSYVPASGGSLAIVALAPSSVTVSPSRRGARSRTSTTSATSSTSTPSRTSTTSTTSTRKLPQLPIEPEVLPVTQPTSIVEQYPEEFQQPSVPTEDITPAQLVEATSGVALGARTLIVQTVENAFRMIMENREHYNYLTSNKLMGDGRSVNIVAIMYALRDQLPTPDPILDFIINYDYPWEVRPYNRSIHDPVYQTPIETYRNILGLYSRYDVEDVEISRGEVDIDQIRWTTEPTLRDAQFKYKGIYIPIPDEVIQILRNTPFDPENENEVIVFIVDPVENDLVTPRPVRVRPSNGDFVSQYDVMTTLSEEYGQYPDRLNDFIGIEETTINGVFGYEVIFARD